MSNTATVLAFDFGASSGRAIRAVYNGQNLTYEEIHRFENVPIEKDGHLCWDVETLLKEIHTAIQKAGTFDSLGFDTWGVDFGLLDTDGHLLANPVHYRDARTNGKPEQAAARMPAEELYAHTGNQIMAINTLFQLLALREQDPELLQKAEKILFMPDLFAALLGAEPVCERSIASTSQMLDPRTGQWSREVLADYGLPENRFAPIVASGMVTGTLANGAKIIAVAGHDTQCASAAMPCAEEDAEHTAFLSCGTWSLLGTELDTPILTADSCQSGLSNELGANGKINYLKNIIGLWLIQESRREYKRRGQAYSFAELEQQALAAEPLRSFIDPDAPEFVAPGDLPGRIQEFCRKTGQPVPETVGAVMRCIYESLALKYRYAIEQLSAVTGRAFTTLHVLGGGTKDRLLCQMTADCCGLTVKAGPVEATALGNIMIQLKALGLLDSITQGRRLIAETEVIKTYTPSTQNYAEWNAAYDRFKALLSYYNKEGATMLYPKIGIRPVIDGRWGGVRESLENQTMRMAENAAKLISENLKYPDGTPVQCVIGCTTIGGGAEAARVAEQFSTQNVTATLSVTPCWCYGTETFDMDPNTIKAVWGFNGTERPGAVYLAAVLAAHAQRGLPAFSIYGHDVQEANDDTIPDDVAEKILRFARGAVAAGWMKNKAYVNIGAVTMGIAGSFCDAGVLQKYFGIRAEWVDEVEILRRISIGIYDHDEYEKALAWVRENCKEGFDKNLGKNLPPVITKSKIVPADKDWEFIVKMTLIIRDILYGNPRLDEMGWHEEALGRNAVVGGFQGQRQWTDWLPNADFTEAIMASTFDWNGPKAPTPFATENDTCNGIAMMLGSLVSGSAPCFHDVRTYWSPEACERVTGQKPDGVAANGFIHLINSGATALDGSGACVDAEGNHVMKPFWEMTDADIKACLNATDWCRADYEYFRGGGYSSHFRCKAEMPVTMLRFNIVEGIGPVLQIAEGWTADLPDEIHNTIDKRTDPTWPTTWFCPRLTGQGAFTDVYSVMANWGANHGVTVYGHVGADLITLASMLRIPVTMHNVPAEKVYRPHAWASFGTQDQQAADYAACKQYGPLYR